MPEVDQTLLRSLAQRGPDGGWARSHGQWRFVQTRLAVIDLSDAVSYPMLNETQTISVLFNGEIYNHVQLRRELVARGHHFASQCDAEVVVHGWEEWGEALFPRLDGMWAIAVGDVDGSLVLARDQLGIKPLVRTTAGPPAFASDAMSLVAAGLADGEVDRPAIDEYLAFHYIPDPATGIVGIERVLPGTSVRVRPNGEAITRAWGPHAFEEPSGGGGVTVDDLGHALQGAVQRQLVADVPVGVFLSGGIDSSLVLHYAVLAGASPAAFTIGFMGMVHTTRRLWQQRPHGITASRTMSRTSSRSLPRPSRNWPRRMTGRSPIHRRSQPWLLHGSRGERSRWRSAEREVTTCSPGTTATGFRHSTAL